MNAQPDQRSELMDEPTAIAQTVAAVKSPTQAVKALQHSLKDIYFVSGLGADERVFRLLKFEGYQPVHLQWLEPEPGEAIEAYAKRLSTQIKSDCPIIVGLSFGGMIAVEIAKQIDVEKVILVSSAKTASEIPPYFKLFRWLPIHRIFPFKSLLWGLYWIANWFFGPETGDERKLLRAILLDTDPHFLKWALHRVVLWKNQTIPERLYHIHGMGDRIFPPWFVSADFILEKAGHLMILNRAAHISTLLEKIIG